MREQIKKTFIESKKFRIVVILELCLLLTAMCGLFGKNDTVFSCVEEMQGEIQLDPISLKGGVYEVTAVYQAESGSASEFMVTDNSGRYKVLYGNTIPLFGDLDSITFTFWLAESSQNIVIRTGPGENSNLTVREIRIRETNAGSRIAIFGILSVSLLLNGIWIYLRYVKTHEECTKKRVVFWGLVGIIGLVSVPLLTDYCINGMDLIFHLVRIEGVKEGLLSGQIPVRIQPNWLYGYGYAASIFYGDTFLAIPALLRMLGLPVQTAYKLFLLVLNIATALTAYVCFRNSFRDSWAGLIAAMLYTWSPYRVYDLYGRAALGETIALTFLPILCYGFYLIFTSDTTKKEYRHLWVLPTIGFTCIIQSHTLSCLMMGGMALLLCILYMKKVCRMQTFLVLCKTGLFTLLINAWFLVPFLDYYITGDFVVNHLGGVSVQARGVYLVHYLFAFFRDGISSNTDNMGMQQTESLGVGFAVTVCLFVYLWIVFTGRYKEKEQTKIQEYGSKIALIGGIVMILSTNFFPWDYLQHSNRIFSALISSLQFPMRLLTVTSLCFAFVAGLVVWQIHKWEKPAVFRIFVIGIMGIAILTTQYLTNDTLKSRLPLYLYNAENMGTTGVGGGEYLPAGTDMFRFKAGEYTAGEGTVITKKDSLYVVNSNSNDSYVDVPLLFYKGYQARDTNSGESLMVTQGENGKVRVNLPAGYAGEFSVSFVSPWYWRAAEIISLLCVLVLGASVLWRRRYVENV